MIGEFQSHHERWRRACGIPLNAFLGWWWADLVAALVMVPIIVKEGVEGLRGDEACADCAST